MADQLDDYSVYSFDFIESDNRIKEYARLITELQKEGPYILFWYSGGEILHSRWLRNSWSLAARFLLNEMNNTGKIAADIYHIQSPHTNSKNVDKLIS